VVSGTGSNDRLPTVWVLGGQLNRSMGALATFAPGDARVLLVESEAKLASKRWHRQRAHLVIGAMRHFAAELEAAGYDVDLRRAPSLPTGLDAHRREHDPTAVHAMEPASWDGLEMLRRNDVELVRSDQFLCHYEEFAAWSASREGRRLRMEDFYHWQRRRLGYLMDGDEPVEGRWNFDAENREPPPASPPWPASRPQGRLDDIDRAVRDDLAALDLWGAPDSGVWATTRRGALARLRSFVEDVLPHFGPHEDAMLAKDARLAHSQLSPYMNIGLLHPREVCDAVEDAYRAGAVPIASAEGFIRQVIGWREYVWGVYWLWMPGYRRRNGLGARRPLPPVFTADAETDMRCVSITLANIHEHGWAHHIQRLMILGNLCLLAGVRPSELVDWMWAGFVDGAEWVMLPNVVGMALHADGGRMATKPYAAGGAYIDRMSDYCGGCRFDRTKRVGDDACPFTTLYWDFLDRHADTFESNHRMAQPVRGLRRLGDLDDVRARAREVLAMLDAGEL